MTGYVQKKPHVKTLKPCHEFYERTGHRISSPSKKQAKSPCFEVTDIDSHDALRSHEISLLEESGRAQQQLFRELEHRVWIAQLHQFGYPFLKKTGSVN